MSKLKTILSEAKPEVVDQMGGRGDSARQKLLANLVAYRRQLTVTFAALFVLLFGLIVVGTYIVWAFTSHGPADLAPSLVKALGIGGGSAAMVEVLRRVWSEWARVSLVLTLIETGTPELVAAIVSTLIGKLE